MQAQCQGCGQLVPSHDTVNYGSMDTGYKCLCGRCFNAEVAKLNSFENFENVTFRPVALMDDRGEMHKFHIRNRLHGDILVLEAFEIRDESPAGYQFQVIGDVREDQLTLLGRLIEKTRRALSIKHLEDGEYGLQIAEHQIVRGLIDCDDTEDDRVPLLLIDGREISWQEFGRMLMTFEGFQFRLEIRDRSEEI